MRAITIQNEDDALRLLESIVREKLDCDPKSITLKGWPALHIHIDGKQFDQSITVPFMEAFVELQHQLWRSYAILKYGKSAANQLSNDEKKALEICVSVKKGSSNYDIDLQVLLEKLLSLTVAKMTGTDIVLAAIGAGVLYSGMKCWKVYLEHRRKARMNELKSAERIKELESEQFANAEETRRVQVVAEAISKSYALQRIEDGADVVRAKVVKSLSHGNKPRLQGISISPSIAEELGRSPHRKTDEVEIKARFNIEKVDSSKPGEFRVTVRNIKSKEAFCACVEDTFLTVGNKEKLQQAEWDRKQVDLRIRARELDGTIQEATILDVDLVRNN